MNNYLEVIKTAVIFFPTIALLMALPFLLYQYHKFGAISLWKASILYLFMFYLLCAYFLVILPLPTFEQVAALTTPRTQLVPFQFLIDFITHLPGNLLSPNSIIQIFKSSYLFVPIYNILLTLPFGIFLHYYCRFSFKKTVLASFLLSLFFELTQLSGLYFIYPRGYRLFDVDDLILNTLGGALGYVIAKPLIKVLPSLESVNLSTREKAKTVSGLRRTLSFVLDLIIFLILSLIFNLAFSGELDGKWINLIILIIYYFLLPILLRGSTPMQKFLNLAVVDMADQPTFWKIWLRRVCFLLIYLILPSGVLEIMQHLPFDHSTVSLLFLLYAGGYFFLMVLTGLKFLFTTKPMLYEKLSQTKLVSTLKI